MNVRNHVVSNRMGGFSLVELMVVIAIIGLLSTIVAINVLGSRTRAMQQKVATDLKVLDDAITLFRVEHSHLPSSLDDLVATDGTRDAYVRGGLDALRDPWKRPYGYSLDGGDASTPYVIWTYGADGAPGGDRENTDISSRK